MLFDVSIKDLGKDRNIVVDGAKVQEIARFTGSKFGAGHLALCSYQ